MTVYHNQGQVEEAIHYVGALPYPVQQSLLLFLLKQQEQQMEGKSNHLSREELSQCINDTLHFLIQTCALVEAE